MSTAEQEIVRLSQYQSKTTAKKTLFLFPDIIASEQGRLPEGQKGRDMTGTVLISIVNDILHC